MISAQNLQQIFTRRPGEYLVLHVGCGSPGPDKLHPQFREPGWREIRLDLDPAMEPDIVATITDMAVVPTGAVQAVWCSHNLEHLYAHEVPQAIGEFYRVLRPEGIALLTMPDLQRVAELVAADRLGEVAYQSPAGPICPIDMIYGHRASLQAGRLLMAHRTGFTASTLEQALRAGGFAQVTIHREGFNLWALAEKTPRG